MSVRLLHVIFTGSQYSAQSFPKLASFRLFTYFNKPKNYPLQKLPKPLQILELISPKGNFISKSPQTHLRLIRDFLQTDADQCKSRTLSDYFNIPSSDILKNSSHVLDRKLESNKSNKWDFQFLSERLEFDASDISNVVSSCSIQCNLRGGIQYHCVALRTGFIVNVYVGSSLINLYCKCGQLKNAYKMFDEMSVRNVVSWTAIIGGFAQEWKVDVCLELFQQMRSMELKPNEFTFASILSACMGSGALIVGRIFHCQMIQMGFDSHLHIANALISMYCKCGAVNSALCIFEAMKVRDIFSWNSMIAGYAQHGLSLQAIKLFESMKKWRVEPDVVTFLGVLSSCRHAGLVEQGRYYFNLMDELGLEPELDHYSCVSDLLGRAGLLKEAQKFIQKMPICPNSIIWGSLLSACRLHGNIWIGIQAAESRLLLQPDCAATHLQLANLYARAGRLDDAARMRKMMKDRGLKTIPGYSWIEIHNKVYRFKAEDKSNPILVQIVGLMDGINKQMRSLGCAFEVEDEVDDTFHET